MLRSGNYQHDIHYWVGKDAEEDDSTMATDKALELDATLGSRAVHYKENLIPAYKKGAKLWKLFST
ncbi:Villin-4 [Dendrobium catenatum]|uniref:Villin-4 n=1 Tax=Dendrobium catenatum TaxID=906689 RepID=A0A2I0VCM3_9ASPA|nr:Villin-4 [Dendrobium catenatum]